MESLGERIRNFIHDLADRMSGSSGHLAAKMELNRLKVELDEREQKLGRKVAKLHRKGVIKDAFLLEALKEEMIELNAVESQIEKTLAKIEKIILEAKNIRDD